MEGWADEQHNMSGPGTSSTHLGKYIEMNMLFIDIFFMKESQLVCLETPTVMFFMPLNPI